MANPIRTYTTKVSGLWSPRHTIRDEEGATLGTLTVKRNWRGMVVSAEYRPEKGEVLSFRRDPGLLRAQFSVWTDGSEWLGSSLRPSVIERSIELWTGGKPYRVVPTPEVGRGWRVVATKTGEVARISLGLVGRSAKIEAFRKVDFEILLFCYFVGTLTPNEMFWPTSLETLGEGVAKKSTAAPQG